MSKLKLIIVALVVILGCVSASLSQDAIVNPWDVNSDGLVDITDLLLVGKYFGDSTAAEGDVNGDGSTDILDIVLVAVHFGEEYKPTKFTVHVAADSGETIELADGAELIIPPMVLSDNATVTVEVETDPPIPTEVAPDERVVGKVYRIDAGDAEFYGPVAITLPYDPLQVPAGADEAELSLAYWDGARWVAQESVVDTQTHTITTQTTHLSWWAPWTWFNKLPRVMSFFANITSFDAIGHEEIQDDLAFTVVVSDEDGLDDIEKVYVTLKLYPLEKVLYDALWSKWRELWVEGLSEALGVSSYFLKTLLNKAEYHNSVVLPIYDKNIPALSDAMNSHGVCKGRLSKEFLQKMLFDPNHEIGTGPISRLEARAFVEDGNNPKASEYTLIINVIDGWMHFRVTLKSPEGVVASPTPSFSWSIEKRFIDNIEYKADFFALYIDDDPDPFHEWRFGSRTVLSTSTQAKKAMPFDRPFLQVTETGDSLECSYILPEKDKLNPGTYYWAVSTSDEQLAAHELADWIDKLGLKKPPDRNKNEDLDGDGREDNMSAVWMFTYPANMPPTITLLKPADGTTTDTKPIFDWESSDPEGDEIRHNLYVDNDNEPFSDPAFYKIVGAGTAFKYGGELPPGTYYWGVKAFNVDSGKVIPDTEVSSDVWSFTIAPPSLYVSVAFLNFLPGEHTHTFEIRNTGTGTLRWRVSLPGTDTWLSVLPTEGEIEGENDQKVTVTIDRTKIPAGTGRESQLIITSGSETRRVAISVEVVKGSPGQGIIFPDPNLEAAVRDELHKPVGVITAEDLASLTHLEADGCEISNLTGIQHLINLQSLDSDENQIIDLNPLSSLTNLERLDLEDNQIIDLSPLSGLINLEGLDLEYNQIIDLSPLSGLTNLQELNLEDNQIIDLSPLSGLANLERLDLEDNRIVNLSPLSGLTNLQRLVLYGNQISDISPLIELVNLERLNLENNPLDEEARNIHIPALERRGVEVRF